MRIELLSRRQPSWGPPGRAQNGSTFEGPPRPPFLVSRRLQKKKCRKGGPKALQKGLAFRPEIGKIAYLGDLELSWGLHGDPDSQNHQNDLQNNTKITYFLSKLRQSTHSCDYYKIPRQKMGSVPPYLSMFFWTMFAGRVPAHSKLCISFWKGRRQCFAHQYTNSNVSLKLQRSGLDLFGLRFTFNIWQIILRHLTFDR